MAVCIDDPIPQSSYPYSYIPSISPTLPLYRQALENTPVETQGWCFVLFNCKAQFPLFFFFLEYSASLFPFCSYSDPAAVEITAVRPKQKYLVGERGLCTLMCMQDPKASSIMPNLSHLDKDPTW